MADAFITYGKYLIVAGVVFLFVAIIEARFPVTAHHQKIKCRYPLSAALMCAAFVGFSVLFAFALGAVDRLSSLGFISIFSITGIPIAVIVLEVCGRSIVLTAEDVTRSYFGLLRFTRSRTTIVRVTRDDKWQLFRVYFRDGVVLWIPYLMRGSAQIAETLHQQSQSTTAAQG